MGLGPGGQGKLPFIYPSSGLNCRCLINQFSPSPLSLLMLTSAFASKDFTLRAYNEALQQRYRFYSFGDCMFIY